MFALVAKCDIAAILCNLVTCTLWALRTLFLFWASAFYCGVYGFMPLWFWWLYKFGGSVKVVLFIYCKDLDPRNYFRTKQLHKNTISLPKRTFWPKHQYASFFQIPRRGSNCISCLHLFTSCSDWETQCFIAKRQKFLHCLFLTARLTQNIFYDQSAFMHRAARDWRSDASARELTVGWLLHCGMIFRALAVHPALKYLEETTTFIRL